MRRSSSTWLSSTALLVLLTGCLGEPGGEGARLCLPPAFDGGKRLHQLPSPSVFWLELLLRQHEVCWRRPKRPDEARIFLLGSSSVLGYPLAAVQTFAASINRHSDQGDGSMHVYNLAMNSPYPLRDAVILAEALPYEPDLILYPFTMAELVSVPPMVPSLVNFFRSNYEASSELRALRPPGLLEPLERYMGKFAPSDSSWRSWNRLREIGRFTRVMAGQHALRYGGFLTGQHLVIPVADKKPSYDCAETKLLARRNYYEWERSNVVDFLGWMKQRTGVEVAIVMWPISHDPNGDCYSKRYTNELVKDFDVWIQRETRARDIPLLDLHDSVPNELFFDTVHLNHQGHQQIAPLIRNFAKSVIERGR